MKVIRKSSKNIIPLLLLFLLLGSALIYNMKIKKPSEEQLIKYEPLISNELKKYHLNEYTPILLAIMDQESRGIGNDPMQSSESAGLKRNEINNPEDSIKQGVYHFSEMYKYGIKRRVDLDTIIQSYNMGPGYIDFVANHGFKHSEELAKSYSELQVQKFPTKYTCGNNLGNFRYPYCFGDFSYALKVNVRLPSIKKILHNYSVS